MFAAKKKLWIIVGAVLALAIIGGGAGAGIVVAGGGDDDQPITGAALDECTAAALAEHPGGTVTETEVGDGAAAYSVEIHLDDGSQVEVDLDESFDVIGREADDDGPNDEDGPNDD